MADLVADLFNLALPGLLTLTIGLVLLYLRYRAEDMPTTQVQRWGMVLLAWLFICNGIVQLVDLADTYSDRMFYVFFVYDLPIVGPTFGLAFALVFPEPVVKQRRFLPLFLALAVVLAVIMAIELADNTKWISGKDWTGISVFWMNVGWLGALLRWIQVYRRNRTNPEISLIASLLIWAWLFGVSSTFIIRPMSVLSPLMIPHYLIFGLSPMQLLAVVIIVLIVHQLYERRGKWQEAERLHIAMFAVLLAFYVYAKAFEGSFDYWWHLRPLGRTAPFMMGNGAILIVRPALILYALLRFQVFGHEVRIQRYEVLIATLMLSFLLSLMGANLFTWVDDGTRGAIAWGAFLVLLFPSYLAARRLIDWALPRASMISRKEARDMYFISLHSALHKGRIDDPRDGRALVQLRRRLKISDREHDLLVEGERLRAREGKPVNRIRHAIFVRDTGQLVANVGTLEDQEQDEAVLASMLTAVRMFVKDAFAGTKGDLDTIQYGKKKLLMELERGYIMAVDLEGEFDPSSRVVVGDLLAVIMRRHWDVLKDWDGDLTDVKVVREDLDRLVFKYNKTGTL